MRAAFPPLVVQSPCHPPPIHPVPPSPLLPDSTRLSAPPEVVTAYMYRNFTRIITVFPLGSFFAVRLPPPRAASPLVRRLRLMPAAPDPHASFLGFYSFYVFLATPFLPAHHISCRSLTLACRGLHRLSRILFFWHATTRMLTSASCAATCSSHLEMVCSRRSNITLPVCVPVLTACVCHARPKVRH